MLQRWFRHRCGQQQTKEWLQIYAWSCSQTKLKCIIMTQPLICEHMTRSQGIIFLNRMHHRNNHLIYEAEGSPLTWFHSSLICTCLILSWIAHLFWKTLWLPTSFTSCNCSCYFCCTFFHQKKKSVFFIPSSHVNWQPGKTHFANKILKCWINLINDIIFVQWKNH